jgi:hypothetical protein
MNKSIKVAKVIILSMLGVGFVLGVIWGTMYLWNWLVPELFNGPIINIWQTLGLLALSRILFGRWGGGCKHKHSSGPWKHYWKERWTTMNPEDREKFKQKLKDKWCYKEGNAPATNSGTSNG